MEKTYTLSDGTKFIFEYDHNRMGIITLECMDTLMSLLKATAEQTEPKPCEWCKFSDGENCFSQEPCKVMLYFKTEPQTDGYMTAEQTEDYRKMLDKAEHKVYGNIEDEGIVHACHCTNCGAEIEYRISTGVDNDN